MKPVKMMYLKSCPYCKQAFSMLETLRQQPQYKNIAMELIEENEEPEKTKGLDYWYVPTFFVDGVKLHEGVPTMEKVEAVLQAAIQDEVK